MYRDDKIFKRVTEELRDLRAHLEIRLNEKGLRDLRVDLARRLEKIHVELHRLDPHPHLASIKIRFSRGSTMAPVAGPITLTTAGAIAVASVLGFDQFGNPFTGPMPVASYSSDDTAGDIATFDPATGLVTAVGNGVANITASLTTAEGEALTDTEAVTVALSGGGGGGTPVLSSIKVAFDTSGAPAPANPVASAAAANAAKAQAAAAVARK
jgi:hypothetical protein